MLNTLENKNYEFALDELTSISNYKTDLSVITLDAGNRLVVRDGCEIVLTKTNTPQNPPAASCSTQPESSKVTSSTLLSKDCSVSANGTRVMIPEKSRATFSDVPTHTDKTNSPYP